MSRVGVFASPDEAREFKQLLLQLRASGFALQGGMKRPPIFEAAEEFTVANTTGEAVPPFAVMQCIGFDGATNTIEVQKPTDRYGVDGPYLINSGREIPIDGRGVGRNAGPITVHCESPTHVYDRYSPEVDQWYAISNPAGNMLYLGESELRTGGNCRFVIFSDYPSVIHAKTTASGIPAATGVSTITMGSESCDLYFSDDSGILTTTDIDIKLFNFSSTAVGASRMVLASRNEKGLWVVTAEDCPP